MMRKTKLVPLFTQEQIEVRIRELGAQISEDYAGEPLVMICVLKGAFMFFSDLVKHVRLDLEVDFIRAASYGDSNTSSGAIRLTKDTELSLADRHVLLVDDIVDSGLTVSHLTREFRSRGVKSLRIAALIDKFERREIDVHVDYPGFAVAEGFICGYGLDYAERHRELPAVYTLEQLP